MTQRDPGTVRTDIRTGEAPPTVRRELWCPPIGSKPIGVDVPIVRATPTSAASPADERTSAPIFVRVRSPAIEPADTSLALPFRPPGEGVRVTPPVSGARWCGSRDAGWRPDQNQRGYRSRAVPRLRAGVENPAWLASQCDRSRSLRRSKLPVGLDHFPLDQGGGAAA